MSKWLKIGDTYEFRVGLLCGVVAPAGNEEFTWRINGGEDGHCLVEGDQPAALGRALINAELKLRDVWLACDDAFYRPLIWQDGPAGGAVHRIAKLDRWRLEAAVTGWWDIAFCDEAGKPVTYAVVEKATNYLTAMRDAETYLRGLGAHFRSTLQFEARNP